MRDPVQEIVFGVTGQTIWLEALEGRPASLTSVQVFRSGDNDTDTAQAATSATAIDAANTVTTAAAGYDQANQTALTVDEGGDIVIGREYLITGADGLYELVVIASKSHGSLVTRSPMINAYATGATVQSCRMTATIDSTWVANTANLSENQSLDWRGTGAETDVDVEPRYRAVFTYVISDGTTRKREIRFDLVRYSSGHLVSPVDVDNRFPGWLDRVPNDYRRQQGRGIIEEAFRAVRLDMLADGNAPRWLRRQDVIGELVIQRAQLFAIELAVMHGKIDPASLDAASKSYRERYDQLVRGKHVEIGSTPGGAIVGGRTHGPLGRR
ncbi:MAG TPA: hypothetical protein PLV92_00395 [Pirellulaceae bacterium]|nr:hypothetical protein [Pirellulaceae bacterium]